MADPTDFEIMLHIQARMPQALAMLKQRYEGRLLQISTSILGDVRLATPIVERVLSFVWKQSSAFDLERDHSVALWLYELVAFYSHDDWQRRRRYRLQQQVSAAFLVSLAGVGGLAYLLQQQGLINVPLLWQEWGISLARSVNRAPDLAQLSGQWRQQPQVKVFVLQSLRSGEGSLEALWSPQDRQVLLLGSGLPKSPPGKVYQLWAVSLGSNPRNPLLNQVVESGGLFTITQEGKSIAWLSNTLLNRSPERFLVTLEPRQGSIRPGTIIVLDSAQVQEQDSPPPSPNPMS